MASSYVKSKRPFSDFKIDLSSSFKINSMSANKFQINPLNNKLKNNNNSYFIFS